jgi:anaerobic ribonucleoside-triphosphate reductase activating protein
MQPTLNIAKFIGESAVNGPGKRSVIWVKGCSKACSGCYNQSFRNLKPAHLYSISSMYKTIMKYRERIQGVTFSGGEPFDQAEALYYLSRLLKKQGLNIMSYSGYTYRELKSDSNLYKQKLLKELDILIDGPYLEELKELKMWKGSSNQNIYFFNQSLFLDKRTAGSELEIIIEEDGGITLTGTFSEDDIQSLYEKL